MLIKFRVKNYCSFKEEQVFSMVAADEKYIKNPVNGVSFDPNISGAGNKFLKVAALYGANASGKTNLLRALFFIKMLVETSANRYRLPGLGAEPFLFASETRDRPCEFSVVFSAESKIYEYGLAATRTQIIHEWLFELVNGRRRLLFDRNYNSSAQHYIWRFGKFLKGNKKLWQESTAETVLFLSKAFKLNSQQLAPVFNWFRNLVFAIPDFNKLDKRITLSYFFSDDGKEKIINLMKAVDPSIVDLAIEGDLLSPFHKILFAHRTEDGEVIWLDFLQESHGTRKLFDTIGAWLNILARDTVLFIDEITHHFHPLVVRFLIQQFYSKKNKGNSQLIFTTHDVKLMSSEFELLQRDQIWLFENKNNAGSTLYSANDFPLQKSGNLADWYIT